MKTLKIKNLLYLTLFLSPLVLAEPSVCLTDFKEKLQEDSIKKVKSMRAKAAKHCLDYEPLEIDGSLYSLTDLQGYVGWNIVERGH